VSVTQVYFAITRHVDAPREQVFRAWIAQRHAPFGYRDVTIPRRLAFTTDAGESLAIVTFAEHRGGTALTFEGSADAGEVDEAEERWRGVLDALVAQPAGSHSRGNAGGIRPG
jgi:uncharacterized protein YndB with AHSA1/START domain